MYGSFGWGCVVMVYFCIYVWFVENGLLTVRFGFVLRVLVEVLFEFCVYSEFGSVFSIGALGGVGLVCCFAI